jgi:hypothetical protein
MALSALKVGFAPTFRSVLPQYPNQISLSIFATKLYQSIGHVCSNSSQEMEISNTVLTFMKALIDVWALGMESVDCQIELRK